MEFRIQPVAISSRTTQDAPPALDTIIRQIEESEPEQQPIYRVILFNDDDHSFDEVIIQIQKATGFNLEKAEAIMLAAHTTGSAVVFCGELERCDRVAAILGQIGLKVAIESN